MTLLQGIDLQRGLDRARARDIVEHWLERIDVHALAFTARMARSRTRGTNLLTVIVGAHQSAAVTPRADVGYEQLHLLERPLATQALLRSFQGDHPGDISGIEAPGLQQLQFATVQKAAHNHLSVDPGLLVLAKSVENIPAPEPALYDPAVSLHARHFSDAIEASADWCGLPPMLSVADDPFYGIAIFFPDYRARIDRIVLRSRATDFDLSRATGETLALKGSARYVRAQHFEARLSLGEAAYTAPFRCTDAVLVDEGGRIIDYARSAFNDSLRPVEEEEEEAALDAANDDE